MIVAILVGGGFGGVLGMFLGVPVFACLQMLVKWLLDRRLTRRGMPVNASAYVDRRNVARTDESETGDVQRRDGDGADGPVK